LSYLLTTDTQTNMSQHITLSDLWWR